MAALADAEQDQSTLQNTEKWNTTNSKKYCSKRISGVSDESISIFDNLYPDYQRFITTDGFEVNQILFTLY